MSRRISSPVFVGRVAELGRLGELRARVVASGQGETVLVTGEAGIGKTRFLRELRMQAEADGWLVLTGACDEFGATARPFSALAEMVPRLGEFIAAEAHAEAERPAWLALQALAGGLAAPPETGSVVQLAQDLFRRVAAVRPLMVVVDDLHWADESTRGLFGTLARGLAACPAILVGAYRGDEVDRAHPLRAVLSAVHRHGTPEVVELAALARDEAQSLAQAVRGGAPPAEFDDLFERSGGNAFFLEELLATPAGTLPKGVRETVLARLNALGTDALAVAEISSLDTAVSGGVLATVSRMETGQFAAALDDLTDSGMLVAVGDEYAFRHALIREVVYDQMSLRQRAALHGQFAFALEATGTAQVSAIASHWRLSSEKEKALESAVAAAEHAAELGAEPESADWYEVAFQLWDEVPEARRRVGRSLADLVLQADTAFAGCRRFDRIIELIRGLLARPQELTAPQRADLWMQLSFRAWQTDKEDVMLPLSIASLSEARAASSEEMEASEQIRLLSLYVGHAIARYGLEEEADEAFGALSKIATENPGAGHPLMAGAVSWQRFSRGERELKVEVERDPRIWLSQTLNRPINDASMLGAMGLRAIAAERAMASLEVAAERGRIMQLAFGLEANIAASLTALGRWDEALVRWDATKLLVGLDPLREWGTLVIQGWGPLLVRTANLEEAAFYREAARLALYPYVPFLGPDALVRVEFARIAGNAKEGRAAITRAIDACRGHHVACFGEPVAYGIALLADASFGSPLRDPDALQEIEHWMDRLRACVDYAPGRVALFDLGVFLEQIAAERARLAGDDSAETWEDLAETWHNLPRPYHEAYCRYRAAFALLMAPVAATRKESRARAAEHLAAAAGICADLGATYLADDVAALQRTSGLRAAKPVVLTPTTATADALSWPALTSRELEVLRGLVSGDSNGQIAIRLGISVKTASVHVSNILRKLEAENRVEAAVRASRMGIAGLR